MNRQQAIEAIKSNPKTEMFLINRDTTGTHVDSRLVWIDATGDLVMAHPTNDTGVIAAPADGIYSFPAE